MTNAVLHSIRTLFVTQLHFTNNLKKMNALLIILFTHLFFILNILFSIPILFYFILF